MHEKSCLIKIKKIGPLTISLIIIISGTLSAIQSEPQKQKENFSSILIYHDTIELPPSSSYYVKFDADSFSLEGKQREGFTDGFSESIKTAIAKSPRWLQSALIQQFKSISEPHSYASLLLESEKKYTDEIAFCIAHSPLAKIPAPDIIFDNVKWIYEIDNFINYATIQDYDDQQGNYSSTIHYTILENGQTVEYVLPPSIYYWYIVHPGLSGEKVEDIYQTFWREFLFSHNDLGYPLLKEFLSNITILWDVESYHQPGYRMWTQWINQHPTAIEAVSYWIGKTVPFLATGDRPIQPNLIAHQHNGYCGELQTLAVAAQRTLLIPSRGANNIGEDHVWREFYHNGWHQNDNWWADRGGCVDDFHVYTDGWGKDMSAVFAERGDGVIFDMTNHYLHPEETINVNFTVYDGYKKPYDGAKITVLVKGIKDITWYQFQIISYLDQLWNTYAEALNGTIIETWYHQVIEYITTLPEVIDSALITTWKYTNKDGTCTLTLGKNDEYIFLIQSPSPSLPWPLATHTAVRIQKEAHDTHYRILLPDFNRKPIPSSSYESEGNTTLSLSYEATWNHPQQNIKNKNMGVYQSTGTIEVFIVDEQNFQLFQQQKSFQHLKPSYLSETLLETSFDNDVYVIFKNQARHATVSLNCDLTINGIASETFAWIDSPRSSLFSPPLFSIGDIIEISGSTNQVCELIFSDQLIEVPPGTWSYQWDTSHTPPGQYAISLNGPYSSDTRTIELFDAIPPRIDLISPAADQIYTASDDLSIQASIHDASDLQTITISIDDTILKTLDPTPTISTILSLQTINPGMHQLNMSATDIAGNKQNQTIPFIIKDPSQTQKPFIQNCSTLMTTNGNWTTLSIHAASYSPIFPIKEMNVFYQNPHDIMKKTMFIYGSNPVLNRHPEDPYVNQSNTPRWGCFLGDFYQGETIHYWIQAIDMYGNVNSTQHFTIDF